MRRTEKLFEIDRALLRRKRKMFETESAGDDPDGGDLRSSIGVTVKKSDPSDFRFGVGKGEAILQIPRRMRTIVCVGIGYFDPIAPGRISFFAVSGADGNLNPVAVGVPRHHRRRGAAALLVVDDGGLAALEDGDARVRRPQIDADDA